MNQDIATRVRQFVQQNFYVEDPARLGDEVSLVNEGIVDSTGMLEVIAFLEEQFAIKVDDAETVPANLETIGRITAFVVRKQQVGVATA
ncbi:MAG: acyl carrier protein [Anaeromyxobacter sp.]|nr:acyl carrier protein [Anaeromyxobacter sp.]